MTTDEDTPAAFGSTESLAVWLAKQKDTPEKRPRDVRQLEMELV